MKDWLSLKCIMSKESKTMSIEKKEISAKKDVQFTLHVCMGIFL